MTFPFNTMVLEDYVENHEVSLKGKNVSFKVTSILFIKNALQFSMDSLSRSEKVDLKAILRIDTLNLQTKKDGNKN